LLKHGTALAVAGLLALGGVAHAQDTDASAGTQPEASTDAKSDKPNILLIVSDERVAVVMGIRLLSIR
jgi:hypothetical protein